MCSATLSGQVQTTAVVKAVEVKKSEPSKCSICHKFHKRCQKCQRVHRCTIECHNCRNNRLVRLGCTSPKTEVKVVGEVKETVAEEEGEVAFCMQLEALEFVAGQERARVNSYEKREGQRARDRLRAPISIRKSIEEGDIAMREGESMERCDIAREEVDGCEVCMVGKAIEQFTTEGIDHMEWDIWKEQFVKTHQQEPPVMKVKVRVLSEVQKQFMGRKARWWTQLGRSEPVVERGLADTGAQV